LLQRSEAGCAIRLDTGPEYDFIRQYEAQAATATDDVQKEYARVRNLPGFPHAMCEQSRKKDQMPTALVVGGQRRHGQNCRRFGQGLTLDRTHRNDPRYVRTGPDSDSPSRPEPLPCFRWPSPNRACHRSHRRCEIWMEVADRDLKYDLRNYRPDDSEILFDGKQTHTFWYSQPSSIQSLTEQA
jgi:hypothetical protein